MRSDSAQLRHRHAPRRDARGFTLVELLITLTVLVVVMGTVAVIVYVSSKSKTSTTNRIESAQGARAALEMMAADLRSAGYGADLAYLTPQPQIAYIDSTQVLINANLSNYPDTAVVTFPVPRAYDPAGNPRPRPLDGTAWQPPIKYRTGAEVIRYTLDADNDGDIDNADATSALGGLAAQTPNPNDFVLLREVFGDSANGSTPGDNAGTIEQIALVRKPGGSVPPMFTVYLRGMSTPYDWSNGPVPAASLDDIERITIQVNSPSGHKNDRGNYAETTLRTEVNSMRNVPNFGATQYGVSGYVFHDAVGPNGVKDGASDPGLPNVLVRLGNYSTYTDASGAFLFHVFDGTYTLRHTPPAGYGCFTSPDSFVLNVSTAMTRSFADTLRNGGYVGLRVFQDMDADRSYDAGEPFVPGLSATMSPGGATGITDAGGRVSLFAQVGGYSASLTLPDTLIVTSTPYPVTGTMIAGGSDSYDVAVERSLTGSIAGKVFRDNDRDGVWDTGEAGIAGVWVGVTNNGGANILGYIYTNATGDYTVSVPINDPPHTTPYSVFIVPPGGTFPTSSTSINNQWVQQNALLTGRNFGVASYTVITLNASRVLSLAAADVIEKDWNGNQTQNAHGDTDLILGADAGMTDNISVWFNQYDRTPLFEAVPTDPDGYTRLAPQSVLSIAADTMDSDATWKRRPDVVTGTKNAATGNLFVWLNQNTSGNYGYLPTSYSPGLAYRTGDNGDVQSVLTLDCAGGSMPDIIAGTKSPTSNYGTIEIWQSNDAVSPAYTRVETYPPAGAIPGATMGEVNTMILSDIDNDGRKDLIVGTKTGTYSGDVLVFKNYSKFTGARFICVGSIHLGQDVVTALAAIDLDGDGYKDIIAGTQSDTDEGNIHWWRTASTAGSTWAFTAITRQAAPGIVLSFATADFGGSSRTDLAVGWRANTSGYVGGIQLFFTDVMGLPPAGVDPSAGSIGSMVPALATGNFNYGTNPSVAGPYLTDLATGVKISATTGALVVFIR